jgi:hypothetical protein
MNMLSAGLFHARPLDWRLPAASGEVAVRAGGGSAGDLTGQATP